MKKVVMYLNQFFGGIGAEDKANTPPSIIEGFVGPGLALKSKLAGGEITHTVICGDDYMNEHGEEAVQAIGAMLEKVEFDLLVAGPAFFAGRYGVNCGRICQYVQERFKVPAITCMYEEAPGVEMYRKDVYILKGGDSAAAMRKDIPKVARLANKILTGEPILWADEEGYFARGIRAQVVLPDRTPADKRAVDMLLKKLRGEKFQSELPIEKLEPVPVPEPIEDMSKARVAIITTGGIVPFGNPDHITTAGATKFGIYEFPEDGVLRAGEWETIHGGYDHTYANANPMTHMPVDALRCLEKEGVIGYLYPKFYATVGNLTNLKDARRMANEIADHLRDDNIQAVILGSA